MADVAKSVGLDGEALLSRAVEPAIKDRFRANTEEAIEGCLWFPTMIVDDAQLYLVTISYRWCVGRLLGKAGQARTACNADREAWGRCVSGSTAQALHLLMLPSAYSR